MVRVKKLEWRATADRELWTAYSIVGTYTCHIVGENSYAVRLKASPLTLDEYPDPEAACAAAQADYEARILSALEPETHPLGSRHHIEHDGFTGVVIGHYVTLEGKPGVVLQLDNARVVHVYGEKWLKEPTR